MAPFSEFEGIVDSAEQLEAIVGLPPAKVTDKVLDHLDELCLDYIAQSPFCLIATTDGQGRIDISPKGDPAGFVRVLDSKRLAIPDRPGNRRADTFHNLVADPHIGLLFLIPGKGETLRVLGEARIVTDIVLRESMAIDGKVPALAVVVQVNEVFVHCPKCMIRSHLWEPENWRDASHIPDIGGFTMVHAKITDKTPEELFLEAQSEGLTELY